MYFSKPDITKRWHKGYKMYKYGTSDVIHVSKIIGSQEYKYSFKTTSWGVGKTIIDFLNKHNGYFTYSDDKRIYLIIGKEEDPYIDINVMWDKDILETLDFDYLFSIKNVTSISSKIRDLISIFDIGFLVMNQTIPETERELLKKGLKGELLTWKTNIRDSDCHGAEINIEADE